jgi:hypothetical protein
MNATTQPKEASSTDIRDLTFGIYDRLYDHDHCTADVVLVPAKADGTPDWKRADPANVESLPADDWPDNPADAARACVIVSNIDGCQSDSTFIVRMNGTAPELIQVHGPDADRDIAFAIIARDIGAEPPVSVASKLQESLAKLAEKFERETEARHAANDNKAAIELPPMHPAPFSPEAAGGLLADISCWISTTAIIPVPELSLTSAIALLAGIFGRVALTPTRAGVNVYLTTLLGTAGGKGWPAKAIRTLSDQPGTMGAVTNGDPTSYAAMERILRKQSSTVVVFDEFGITLQDVNAKHKNSVAAGIRKFLLAVYDQSNSVFDGRIYASAETKKDEAPIIGPALTVLGMTTVETLYAGLSEASVADGFLNRFMFITATPHDGPVTPPHLDYEVKPPEALLSALSSARSSFPAGRLPRSPKFVVPMDGGEDGEAYKRWGQIFIWQQAAKSDLAGRAAENTIRLATIRAISRNPASSAVNLEDVEWGWAIVYSSIRLIEEGVRLHMAASPAEALRKAILSSVEATPGLPYSKLAVRKGVSGATSRELFDALVWLIAAEQVEDISNNRYPGAGSKFRSKKLE